jgi:quercetin dioxygenase-like cupin family protein
MSMAYLAQPEQQQQLEWLDGGTLAILLDGKATDGQLMVGRFDVSEGEAPPYHKHTREDEVFMLIKGTALVWYDDQELELSEGGIVFLPKNIPHAYRITSKKADLLMINTPAGIEGMFRYAGRDRAMPRPEGFEISPERMARPSALTAPLAEKSFSAADREAVRRPVSTESARCRRRWSGSGY